MHWRRAIVLAAIAAALGVTADTRAAPFAGPGRIAFVGSIDGQRPEHLYVVNVDGSQLSRLTEVPCCSVPFALSQDGRWVAFTTNGAGSQSAGVAILNIADSTIASQPRPPGRIESMAFSPDGRTIAVATGAPSASGAQIVLMHLDSGRATSLATGVSAQSIAYSPDGRTIAFDGTVNREMLSEIFTIGVDGTNFAQVTQPPVHAFHPMFDPSGRHIVFESGAAIYVMDADGSRVTRLSPLRAGDLTPAVSIDGRYIAFVSAIREFPQVVSPQIYVMRSDGTGLTRITGAAWAQHPVFIP